jgi:hypothetical protein
MTKKKDKIDPREPYKLTPDRAKIVLENVRSDLSVTNASRIAGLSPQTPLNWITRGKQDKDAGIESTYTKFLDEFYVAQGLKVREFMRDVATMNKGWQAVAWLLEKCCAEDFGKDSELYKQLLEDYKMLMQSLVDQNKGVNHGNETASAKTL